VAYPDGCGDWWFYLRKAGDVCPVAVVRAQMTFLDAQTDEHALDALDRLATIPAILQPIAAAGVMHAGLAVVSQHLGHSLATELLRDLQRQIDHWRDEGQIDG